MLILGMCFLFGGLRFREQVCHPSLRRCRYSSDVLEDIQQYRHPDERLPTKPECHESFATGSSSKSQISHDWQYSSY